MHISRNFNETYHEYFLWNIFNFGGCGVDIFFVLSGFIITYSNASYIGKPASTWSFLKKRGIRIFPVYWIVVIFFLSLQLILPSFYKTPFEFTPGKLLYTFLLFPGHEMINGVSWSLTNELFFYLIFTLALFIRNLQYTFLLLGAYLIFLLIFPLIHFSNLGGFTNNNSNGFAGLITFPMNIEFLLGVLVVPFLKIFPQKWCRPFAFVSIGLIVLSAILYNYNQAFFQHNYHRVFMFGLPAFMLILAIVKYERRFEVSIPNFWLQLGNASYSIYLLHLPMVAAFFKITRKLPITNHWLLVLLACLLLVVVCIVGIIFFKKIEKPLILRLNKALI